MLPQQLVVGHVVLLSGMSLMPRHVLRLGRPHHRRALRARCSHHRHGDAALHYVVGAAFVHDTVIAPPRPVPQFAPYATYATIPCPTRTFYTFIKLIYICITTTSILYNFE